MASSNSVPGFKASVDGLHFINSWPREPDIVVDAGPLGKVPIGDASNGLCGREKCAGIVSDGADFTSLRIIGPPRSEKS